MGAIVEIVPHHNIDQNGLERVWKSQVFFLRAIHSLDPREQFSKSGFDPSVLCSMNISPRKTVPRHHFLFEPEVIHELCSKKRGCRNGLNPRRSVGNEV